MLMSGRMHVSEPVRRIELFTGEGRRRAWSDAEKAAIVAESYASEETVCGVARRHGLTPQQLFTWRRIARRERPQPERRCSCPRSSRRLWRSRRWSRNRLRNRDRDVPGVAWPRAGSSWRLAGVTVRVGAGASPKAIAAVIGALKASA